MALVRNGILAVCGHRDDNRIRWFTRHSHILSPDEQEPRWVSKPKRGVPPFGHNIQLRVFVDPDLLQYDEVWAAAGTWNDNFGAAPADIVRVAGGVVTDLKRG